MYYELKSAFASIRVVRATSSASYIENSGKCIIPAMIFDGNISFLSFRFFTAALYARLAHCIRSSISDHWV